MTCCITREFKAQLYTFTRVQDSEHLNLYGIVKSQARYQTIGKHSLQIVHGAVVVNGHAKRLISSSFPDVVIFRRFGTWTAHSHSIRNLREKKADILRILHLIRDRSLQPKSLPSCIIITHFVGGGYIMAASSFTMSMRGDGRYHKQQS